MIGKNVRVVVHGYCENVEVTDLKSVKYLSLNNYMYFANVSELIFIPFVIKCRGTTATKWQRADLKIFRMHQSR
jgi:hypothetical protein